VNGNKWSGCPSTSRPEILADHLKNSAHKNHEVTVQGLQQIMEYQLVHATEFWWKI
jgi:hypothetical protein